MKRHTSFHIVLRKSLYLLVFSFITVCLISMSLYHMFEFKFIELSQRAHFVDPLIFVRIFVRVPFD